MKLIRHTISTIKKVLALMPFLQKKYHCTVCGNAVTYFLPAGVKAEILSEKQIIGAGYRKHVRCPICGANDRMRFLDYVLRNKTDIYTNPKNHILHFAPEKCIENKIRSISGGGYVTGDIRYGIADKIVDVTDICYPEGIFDYVIINHVLEHIKEERKAMLEIKRVLKPGGKIIFSMPICEVEDTYEADGNLSEEECLRIYGQKDHVRLYGKDVKEHMEKYGYKIVEYKANEILEEKKIKYMRILAKDRIFIGQSMK